MIRYAIVKPNDKYWGGKIMPWTVPMQDLPKGTGKGQVIPETDRWRQYDRDTNSEGGYRWLHTVNTMLYNQDTDDMAERITCVGNFVSFDDANNQAEHILLRTFSFNEDPYEIPGGGPAAVNWLTRPDLFSKATATDGSGKMFNVSNGKDVYFALKNRNDNTWLAFSQVEFFPALPFTAYVNLWVGALRIRTKPDPTAPLVSTDYLASRYFPGTPFKVLEYRPRGASVWARTDRGWVCLLQADKPGQRSFYTNWVLKSPGVIPPFAWPPQDPV